LYSPAWLVEYCELHLANLESAGVITHGIWNPPWLRQTGDSQQQLVNATRGANYTQIDAMVLTIALALLSYTGVHGEGVNHESIGHVVL
jgi:hypothetical protein